VVKSVQSGHTVVKSWYK